MPFFCSNSQLIRSGTQPRRGVGIRCSPVAAKEPASCSRGFALIAEAHDFDWSGEPAQPHLERKPLETILDAAFAGLCALIHRQSEYFSSSDVGNGLLTVFQTAHTLAKSSGTVVSLLVNLWLDERLFAASIGSCKGYLIRCGRATQTNTDDYVRLTIDGVAHQSTSILSNVIGMGRAESIDDIHLTQVGLESRDLLLLGSSTFQREVSEDMLSLEANRTNIDDFCRSLAERAIERTDSSDALALFVTKFER